jgi:hypothetical protein
MIAELTIEQPAKFAIISVDPTQRHEDGGCAGTVLSLHRTREEAERIMAEDFGE